MTPINELLLAQLIIESSRCQGVFLFSDFVHMPMNIYSITMNNRAEKVVNFNFASLIQALIMPKFGLLIY